jgi:hypothetical protein
MQMPPNKPLKTPWSSTSRFHELSDIEVLKHVSARVGELKKKSPQERPLVLLDMDSTLYEVGPRTFQILREWMDAAESQVFSAARAALQKMRLSDVGYSVRETFGTLGLDMQKPEARAAWESAKAFWGPRFFTSEYLRYDVPYPGAADFTRELYGLGAEIVYLTGRDEPGMGEGTRKNLLRDGFPWEVERTHLLLKASTAIPDLDHKKGAAAYIQKTGRLVASFENEPRNLLALQSLFPEAMHVFVDTVHSDEKVEPGSELYRIAGFQS